MVLLESTSDPANYRVSLCLKLNTFFFRCTLFAAGKPDYRLELEN